MTSQEQLMVEAVRRGLINPASMARMTGRVGMPTSETEANMQMPRNAKASILPFSTNAQGKTQFDLTAGLPGQIWNALTLPGDVVTGKTPIWGTSAEGKPVLLPITPGTEQQQRTMGLATLATPINPAVRAGDLAIPGEKTSLQRATPTPESVMAAGRKGFTEAREMPVDFSPESVVNLSQTIRNDLNERGLPEELAPTTHRLLAKIEKKLSDSEGNMVDDVLAILRGEKSISPEEAGSKVVSANNIITMRKTFQYTADSAAKTAATNPQSAHEYAAAVAAIDALDEFIGRADTEGSATGPVAAFKETYDTARANIAAAKRAELLEKKQAIAEYRAAAAHSGRNIGNTLRQRLTDLLARPEKIRGWTQEEKDALEAIVNGTGGMNSMRTLSNRLGGGGGAVSTILGGIGGAGGYAAGGPGGAVLGTVLPVMAGTGTRKIYNTMVSTAVDRLEEMLLQRSPEFAQAAGTIADNPRALTAFLRAALLAIVPPKSEGAYDLYMHAKKQRDALRVADEKMRRGLPPRQ